MNEENLIKYYNKFNEDKRLNSKYGQIEFITSLKYIHEYLNNMDNPKIIDIGAGSGRYSITLAEEGYDITAVELVKHNLRMIEQKSNKVKAYQGNAINLKKFKDDSFDLTLVFGPMYHLCDRESQLKALEEAKRITKKNGIIMVAYCMNDAVMIQYEFGRKMLPDHIKKGMITDDFHCISKPEDLFEMVRTEEIKELTKDLGVKRMKLVATDGATGYMRDVIDNMDEELFDQYVKYHLSVCEREDLIGATNHSLDILRKDSLR